MKHSRLSTFAAAIPLAIASLAGIAAPAHATPAAPRGGSLEVMPDLDLIPDPNLRSCVSEAVDAAMADVPEGSTGSLNVLVCPGRSITDLSGVEQISTLTDAVFPYNQISDLSPLASIPGLQQLALGFNRISDVSPLAHHPTFKTVNLDSQTVSLPDIVTGAAQPNPLVGFDGAAIEPASDTAAYDAETNTLSFPDAGEHRLTWTASVPLVMSSGRFTGTIRQTVVDPEVVQPPVVGSPVIEPHVAEPPVLVVSPAAEHAGALARTGADSDLRLAGAAALLMAAGVTLMARRTRKRA